MAINLNNSSILRVNYNNVRMEKVFINGVQVLEEMSGAVTLVSSNSTSFSPGAEDVNRHFVILSGRFSSNALGTGPVPTINSQSGTTILNQVNNQFNDGGRCGIFTFKIPTGTSTFTVENAGDPFCVFRVVGVPSMTSAFATAVNAGGPINVASPASPAKGCGFVVAVNNFGSVGAISGTDSDLRYNPGNPGFGANRNVTNGTHAFGGNSQMNIAATFQYAV
jgi:hypothetical protein